MKHRYIVISSFFIATLILTLLCYGSYLFSEKNAKENQVSPRTALTGENPNEKLTSDTQYRIEVYNQDTDKLVTQNCTIPTEYVGMTRKELEHYLQTSFSTLTASEEEAGLVSFKLKSFSKEKLVVRKTYQNAEQKSGFFLKLTDDEVVIYNRDGTYVYEKTGIKKKDVPKAERKKLEKGYIVENEKDLYSILENFSS